jgi:hypothetical protein
MRNRAWSSAAVVAIALLAGTQAAAASDRQCEVTITTPQPGDQVGKDGRVRGTAEIPDGAYLWVLAHMKDLAAEWWPQGNRPAVVESDGKWVIIAAYGRAEDVSAEFEVAAVVVNANTNARLLDWAKTAKDEGYPPIAFPDAVDGCVPVKVSVKKTAH